MYIKKLLRFNNSIGVILPKPLVKAIDLKYVDLVVFSLEDGDKITLIQYDKWVKNKRAKRSKSL